MDCKSNSTLRISLKLFTRHILEHFYHSNKYSYSRSCRTPGVCRLQGRCARARARRRARHLPVCLTGQVRARVAGALAQGDRRARCSLLRGPRESGHVLRDRGIARPASAAFLLFFAAAKGQKNAFLSKREETDCSERTAAKRFAVHRWLRAREPAQFVLSARIQLLN
jgi:hypothetical protein